MGSKLGGGARWKAAKFGPLLGKILGRSTFAHYDVAGLRFLTKSVEAACKNKKRHTMTASRLLIQKNKQQTHPQMHPRMMWGNEENKLSLDEASHLELHALVIAKQGLSNSSRSSDKSLDKAPLLSEALLAYAS